MDVTGNEIASKYIFIKNVVRYCGYEDEITWQENVRFDDLDESSFLKELAWVVLSSGFREQVISNIFGSISNCFFNWESANMIVRYKTKCLNEALKMFNNKLKIQAIIDAACKISERGFTKLKEAIREDPIKTLNQFSFIGPTTVYHLAKNIGLNVAKPDRHLSRIASQEGYPNVQDFCSHVASASGDSVPVVDIVFWRFATIEKDYLKVIEKI